MRKHRISTLLRLSCVMSTLMVAAVVMPEVGAGAATIFNGPGNAMILTLPAPGHTDTFTVTETIPAPASPASFHSGSGGHGGLGGNGGRGGAGGVGARSRWLFAHGISVSVVPVLGGKAASPLTSSLVSMRFSPHRGRSGSWSLDAPAGTLTASNNMKQMGLGASDGHFTYTPTANARTDAGGSYGGGIQCGHCCQSTAPNRGGCGGTGAIHISVKTALSAAVARKLTAIMQHNSGGLAIAVGMSDGSFVYTPTQPAPGFTDPAGRTLTVGLDPSVSVPAGSPLQALPVLSKVVKAAFSPNPVLTQGPNRGIAPAGSNTGCGSVMGTTSASLDIASGFLNFIPVVGSALGAVSNAAGAATGLMGDNAGDACIQAEFSLINGQLADQEGQIQNLQVDYALEQNQIYQAMVDGANAQTNLDLTNYNNALDVISPSTNGGPGIFGKTMEDLQFWQANYTPVAGASISGSSSGQPFFATAAEASSASSTFPASLNNLSGSAVDNTACSTTTCPKTAVVANLSSSLVNLWVSEAQQLKATAKLNRNQGTNVVPLFDQYNNAITEQFQNSLGVLQQAYSLESMVNQLNYDHATTECTWGQAKDCTMISSFGGVPGTLYSYCLTTTAGTCPATTTAAQTTIYNQAQQQLSRVYSWRVNQLYATALSFLQSDAPIAPQAYPLTTASGTIAGNTITSGPIAYGTLLGSGLPSLAGAPASPLASLPAAVTSGGSTWESNGALYQYSGIYDANACATTIIAANLADGASAPPPADPCSAIFLTGAGGPVDEASYTGNILQPYTSQGGSVILTGVEQANLLMCTPGNAALGWYTPPVQNTGNAAGLVAGAWYLNCGNWATVTNTTTCFPGATCPLGWSDPVSSYSWLYSQYYSFGPGSYPDLANNTYSVGMDDRNDSGVNVMFNGASGCGGSTTVAWFANGQLVNAGGSNSSASLTSCGSSLYVKSGDSYQGVTGLRTQNQVSSQSGLQVPLAWRNTTSGNNITWSWEPEQVPSSAIGTYGFTCSGMTCTMVDGSQWTVPITYYSSTALALGLSQVLS